MPGVTWHVPPCGPVASDANHSAVQAQLFAHGPGCPSRRELPPICTLCLALCRASVRAWATGSQTRCCTRWACCDIFYGCSYFRLVRLLHVQVCQACCAAEPCRLVLQTDQAYPLPL